MKISYKNARKFINNFHFRAYYCSLTNMADVTMGAILLQPSTIQQSTTLSPVVVFNLEFGKVIQFPLFPNNFPRGPHIQFCYFTRWF